jgi:tetratricopeptide (TPR) repeat protein
MNSSAKIILISMFLLVALLRQPALAELWDGAHALRSHPAGSKSSNFEQLSKAASDARAAQRDDEALALYQRALNMKPDWDEGLWYSGTLMYEKERYAEARDVLRRFVAHNADAGPGWAVLGMSEFQTREYARSLEHLKRAMSLGMGAERKEMTQSVFYFVSVLLARFEYYDDAMNMLIAMVKSGRPTENLIEPIGLAVLRMPLLPAEIPAERREMVRDCGRATLAVEAQHRDEAENLFSGVATKYDDEPMVHFLYGAFLLDSRPEEGIAHLRRELDVSPFSISARLRLSEEYVKEGKLAQALPLAQQAVKLEPEHGTTHMILGEVLMATGDSNAGLRELEMARQYDSQTVRIHWDLLRAYTAAGRDAEAKNEKEEIEKLSLPKTQGK